MLEHFWSRLTRQGDGAHPRTPSLRDAAMRSFYLDEGRSEREHPPTASMWRRMIKRIIKQRSSQSD